MTLTSALDSGSGKITEIFGSGISVIETKFSFIFNENVKQNQFTHLGSGISVIEEIIVFCFVKLFCPKVKKNSFIDPRFFFA